mgnify:CR=1 FL=1
MKPARSIACLPIVATLLLAAGCASISIPYVSQATFMVTQSRSFTLAKSDRALGWGFLSHPRIFEPQGKAVYIAWNTGGDYDGAVPLDELGSVAQALTSDGGKTWKLGKEADYGSWSSSTTTYTVLGGSVRDLAGQVTFRYGLVFNPHPESNNEYSVSMGARVNKQGEWSCPEEITCTTPKLVRPLLLSVRGVQRPDGSIILVGETTFENDVKSRTILLESTDGGRHFYYLSTVATPEDVTWVGEWAYGFNGPCEPSIALLSSNELLCVMRTGVKQKSQWEPAKSALRMLQARSRDGGRTWSRKCLSIEGVYPKLLLMKNGILVMAFGRPGNNLVFSADGGRSWSHELALSPADVRTSGYVDMAEVGRGRLLAVFDVYNYSLEGFWLWEPTEVNGVLGRFVNVWGR